MERGHGGLILGRTLTGLAVGATIVIWSFAIAAPGYMIEGPGTVEVAGFPIHASVIWLAVGIVGPVTGLRWMWRIHRSHLEPEPRHWRYRDVD